VKRSSRPQRGKPPKKLGLTLTEFAPLWERTVEFSFRGTRHRQLERYFLLRDAQGDLTIGPTAREIHAREGIASTRWWTPEEIETTTEQVFPENLLGRPRELWTGVAAPDPSA
jgi:hypothetical protein